MDDTWSVPMCGRSLCRVFVLLRCGELCCINSLHSSRGCCLLNISTRAVQNRGANVQSASRQRAAISATSCRRRWPQWPARSASSAVSKYQLPGCAAHQAVYYWQPCFSGCRSSSLERSARGRRLIVIIAVFPPIKNSSFSTFIPSRDFWPFDWYRYSSPCSNVRYLGHFKSLCLLTYLLTYFNEEFETSSKWWNTVEIISRTLCIDLIMELIGWLCVACCVSHCRTRTISVIAIGLSSRSCTDVSTQYVRNTRS